MSHVVQRHVRVVRGPDWPADSEEDGGEGGLGTVIDVDLEAQRVTVAWDNGNDGEYSAGHQREYQLLLYDNSAVGSIRHFYVTCDGCKTEPIRGVRWKCLDCDDFDLCTPCYMKAEHELNHGFMRMTSYEHCGKRVPVRKDATRVKARGFFPGAKVILKTKDANDGVGGTITQISRDGTASVLLEDSTSVEVGLFCGDPEIGLKAVEVATGDEYYKDHLANLEEYSGVKRGDAVSIMIDEETFNAIQSSHLTAWRDGMETLIGGIGILFEVRGTYCAIGYLDGNRVFVNTDVLTKIRRFKKNDRVRIADDLDLAIRVHRYDNSWNEGLEKALGKEGRILSYSESGKPTINVEIDDDESVKVTLHPGLLEFKEHGPETDDDDLEEEENEKSSREADEDDDDDDDSLTSDLFQLIAAANDGDASRVKSILTDKPELVNKKYRGACPIHIGASSEPEVLKAVLEAGGKVDIRDKKRSTPLQYAAESDQSECIQLLLDKGAKVNAANKDGYTALHAAAKEGNLKSVRLLLQNGARIDMKEDRGRTAFHFAVVKGFVSCVELLIEFGCDVNTQDRHGDTPAHDAIMQDLETFDIILESPTFKPDVVNKRGFNVLQYAALRERERMLAELIKKFPKLVDSRKEDKFTSLHIAVLNGHLGCVKILCEQGKCDINAENNIRHTPLHVAVQTDQPAELEYLLDRGAKVNIADIFGKTPLHLAASKHKEGSAMSETPTLKEIKSKYKKFGVTNATASVMCLLVQKGASLTAKEMNGGKTPLSYIGNKQLRTLLEKLSKGEMPEEEEEAVETNDDDLLKQDRSPGTVIEGLHRISISEITMERVLGRGSFGVVTKATWRGTPVAVKAIPIDVAVRERVEHQLSVHRQTTHPNIVELMALSFNPEKSEILIVMEFIDGMSLHDAIFSNEGSMRLNRKDKIDISKQILQAVCFIHRSHILHLNIKPANILLDGKTKKAYLSDLGLAHMKFLSDETEKDSGLGFQGTVSFLPPEGVRQSSGDSSNSSADPFKPAYDVWSLGGTLVEMFAEKDLWGDDVEVFFVIAQLLQGTARPRIIDDVEPAIKTILAPCFEPRPEDRPSVAKLLSQFQNIS